MAFEYSGEDFLPDSGPHGGDAAASSGKVSRSGLKSLFGAGSSYIFLAIVMAVVAIVGTLMILGNAAERGTYYVLGQDIPARTLVTPEMLVEVSTAAGSEPPRGYTPGVVARGDLYSKVPLQRGDVVSASVAGPLARINAGIPENFVVSSFKVAPENAAAGKVRRGDRVDVVATIQPSDGDPVTKVVLSRVLVLDVLSEVKTISKAAQEDQAGGDTVGGNGPESKSVRAGIPQLYTVALSPSNAIKLAAVSGSDLHVFLSSNAPQTADGKGVAVNDLVTDVPDDASAGIVFDPAPAPSASPMVDKK
jgi:Flp pilus assembly protein CpaB